MKNIIFRNAGFIASVCAAICATALICIFAVRGSSSSIKFDCSYYFVCYRIAGNSVSASSLSGTVSSYGGAGYILDYDGNYYVTVSCYYSESEAKTVCSSLKKRELDCFVLDVTTGSYKLSGTRNRELYLGNLNTLNSLSHIAYDCANKLDTGEITQNNAKEVISSIKSGLNGLLNGNKANCFTDILERLIAECDDKSSGYIYSKDMRYIQIMLADSVINAEIS